MSNIFFVRNNTKNKENRKLRALILKSRVSIITFTLSSLEKKKFHKILNTIMNLHNFPQESMGKTSDSDLINCSDNVSIQNTKQHLFLRSSL